MYTKLVKYHQRYNSDKALWQKIMPAIMFSSVLLAIAVFVFMQKSAAQNDYMTTTAIIDQISSDIDQHQKENEVYQQAVNLLDTVSEKKFNPVKDRFFITNEIISIIEAYNFINYEIASSPIIEETNFSGVQYQSIKLTELKYKFSFISHNEDIVFHFINAIDQQFDGYYAVEDLNLIREGNKILTDLYLVIWHVSKDQMNG